MWLLTRRLAHKHRPEETLTVILVPTAWRTAVWQCVHVHSVSHLGYERVFDLLQRRFAWSRMWEDVQLMCRACVTCQKSKVGAGGGKSPMKHEYVGYPHERVGIDLQGPLPETVAGYKYICVIQDYFSKRMELYPLRRKTAEEVADVLFREYIARHGAMRWLHSDQGTEFDNHVCLELCKLYGVGKSRTTPYVPWSNGMVERSNKTIKAILRALNVQEKDNWDELLPYVYMAYNATPHASTGFTPHRLFYSQCADPLLPVDLMFGCDNLAEPRCHAAYVFQHKERALQTAEVVRSVTGRAVQVQMNQKDKHGAVAREYRVGDLVLMFSPPNKREVLNSQPWTGPHEVIEVRNDHLIKIKVRSENDSTSTEKRGRRPKTEKLVHTRHLKPFTRQTARTLVLTRAAGPSSSRKAAGDRRWTFEDYWTTLL